MNPAAIGKLTVLKGPSIGSEFELTKSTMLIGRDPGGDVILTAPGISRQHALITRKGDLFYIEDLGSSNGTFLNGQRITESLHINPGDEIGFGQNVSLRFEVMAVAARIEVDSADDFSISPTALDQPAPEGSEIEPPTIVVSVGGTQPKTYELTKAQITLGRAGDNDIILDSPIISRYHARLMQIDSAYQLVVEPQAGNPIYFNNQPLTQPHRLRNGDELRIGRLDSNNQVTLAYFSSSEKPANVMKERPIDEVARGAGTMLAQDYERQAGTTRPTFQVIIAGESPQTYSLTEESVTIGRASDNNIILDSKIVSRYHARLERVADGYQIVPLADTLNAIHFEGRPLASKRLLRHSDKLRIGGHSPGTMVTMIYRSQDTVGVVTEAQTVQFNDNTVITIGRDATNDVVLDAPIVSRFHARVERVGQRYRVRDLRSANGTFVDDEQIEGDVWLKPEDTIRIGPYRFVMGQDQLAQYDDTGGLRVEAVGLNKWVRKDLNILQYISLVFKPREFIVVVGQSGGGKSTLIDAIAGYRPATHGKVFVNDIDVYRNFNAIRNDIGYVPQRDIIHTELTVFQALDYAAQLRMPADTTKEERHKRIEEVLQDLDLAHRKDVAISGLSGGQQKRVSIGVELLTKPGLFFLDEPTSGLDPGTETSLMQLMRRLADQGRTIVLITHATKNVMLADKVVFLARGGYLSWFGPPDEALEYFDQFRSDRDRRALDIEFDEIYAILGDPSKGEPENWGERYQQHPAYEQYISLPLQERAFPPATGQPQASPPKSGSERKSQKHVSSFRQFSILSARNIKILTRDKFSLGLMLAAAPLVAMLDVILAVVLGRNPFDFNDGFMANVLITLFLLTVYGVMVGGLAQMREIVKEQEVYKRERLVNLKIVPYIMSKTWFAALLALYITTVYVVVHYLAFDMPGGVVEFGIIYISLALATMAGMMLGLFASTVAPNSNSAPLIVILLMLPQIVLGGALVPLPEFVSAPTSTRWAFQAFMATTGSGSDVAADACWQLPQEQLELILESPIDEKDATCNCMGTNAVREETCNFPGNGTFYSAAIDEPPPTEPGEPPEPPGDRPIEPELPPEPEEPADDTDLVALSDYQEAIRAWRAEVELIQDAYRAEIADYEAEVEIYQAQLEAYQAEVVAYQTDLARWEAERLRSAGPAEQIIAQSNRDFGWLFVNKDDSGAFWSTITFTWLAQGFIIILLFVVILILQKRKDVT